eukprot:15456286-Alexandrium_andersonii.AAC.1
MCVGAVIPNYTRRSAPQETLGSLGAGKERRGTHVRVRGERPERNPGARRGHCFARLGPQQTKQQFGLAPPWPIVRLDRAFKMVPYRPSGLRHSGVLQSAAPSANDPQQSQLKDAAIRKPARHGERCGALHRSARDGRSAAANAMLRRVAP